MYRIDNSTAQPTRPTPLAPGPQPNGYFTGGAPAGPAPTRVDADFLNAVQEELMHPVLLAGLTPDKTNNAQLLQALASILAAPFQWLGLGTTNIVAPAWATRIAFEMVGAGGGGGYCQRSGVNYSSGGGGGAGGFVIATRPVTPGATLTWVGGTGGASDTNGGNSTLTFGSTWTATATGGQAPIWTQPNNSQGGGGGSGSFAGIASGPTDTIYGGGSGGDGTVSSFQTTGHGSGSPYGGGGRAGSEGGIASFASGAGGGGAYDWADPSTQKWLGGRGGDGACKYRWLP